MRGRRAAWARHGGEAARLVSGSTFAPGPLGQSLWRGFYGEEALKHGQFGFSSPHLDVYSSNFEELNRVPNINQ